MGSSPRVVDWNNDGRKDLVVGERDGHIRLFLNSGTDAVPAFSGFTYIEVGSNPFDCGYNSMPVIVDWNEDGKKDLLCGEHDGKIFILLNTGTDAAPLFQSTSFVQDGAGDLDIGGRTSPDVVDWDRDGKKDIVAGETMGNIFFVRNVGTNAAPAFNGYTLLEAGGQTIDVDYNSRPFAADWDNDGVQDLLCGCFDTTYGLGYVWYFHALGPLSASDTQLSAAAGGSIGFDLDAGAAMINRGFLLVGSMSGTEPGTPLPGGLATLPLNRDWFTDFILARLNSGLFQNFQGTLDASGQGAAQLNAPPFSPTWVGTTMHYAFATTYPFDYASNAVAVEIVP